jgi:uncharacterized damage-inducible protein DinB
MLSQFGSSRGIAGVLLETFAANALMSQLMLKHVDQRCWRAQPIGQRQAGLRTIAELFAHMHNNRLSWLARSASHLHCPAALDPLRCTIRQTAIAHRRSAARCLQMLGQALADNPHRLVTKFSRGSWAEDWPAGATMFAYMFAHDAHHRGQILLLARQAGYPFADEAAYGIWHWETFWSALGNSQGPR